MMMEVNATQQQAAQSCQAWGGGLITYPTPQKQQFVEVWTCKSTCAEIARWTHARAPKNESRT
jgi:hypothetical protein